MSEESCPGSGASDPRILELETQLEAQSAHIRRLEAEVSGRWAPARTEALLRESEERFRALVEGSFEGLAITVDGKIVEANEAFVAMGKCTRAEVIGHSPLEFVTPESTRVLSEHLQTGSESPYEVVVLRPDGSTFPCEVLGRNILYGGRPARITAFRDVSERRRMETARLELEARMRESEKLENLGMLAGGIAHDFNNLLGVVLGNAGLALQRGDEGAKVSPYLECIRTAALRASELTKQMLTYAGRGESRKVPVDLSEVVREIAELLRVTVPKGAALVVDLSPDLPTIDADPGQLRQVIMNLIANSADALPTDAGEIRVTTRADWLSSEELKKAQVGEGKLPEKRVLLEVSDTGVGIEPDVLSRIFDPFFTTKFAGRGLGLASVSGIVRAHGGSVRVQSERGRGSQFTVSFPLGQGVDVPVARSETQSAPLKRPGFALVVDDEPLMRDLACETLGDMGITAVSARDGVEALRVYQKHEGEFDLVVLDLAMPELGGIDVTRRIRAMSAAVPIILISGYTDSSRFSDLLSDEGVVLLAKPFEPAALARAAASLLNRRASVGPG